MHEAGAVTQSQWINSASARASERDDRTHIIVGGAKNGVNVNLWTRTQRRGAGICSSFHGNTNGLTVARVGDGYGAIVCCSAGVLFPVTPARERQQSRPASPVCRTRSKGKVKWMEILYSNECAPLIGAQRFHVGRTFYA